MVYGEIMLRTWMTAGSVVFCPLQVAPVPTAGACTTPHPCESSATSAGGVLMVCPAGDGPNLSDIGATISVTLLYCLQVEPVIGVPPQDLWIQSKLHPDPRLCGGAASSNADLVTDVNGQTTMSGSIAAGGYFGDGVYVVALGSFIQLGESFLQPGQTCDNPLPLVLVSPDINGDLVVDLLDLSAFAAVLVTGGGTVDPRMDFDGDGQIGLVDVSLFAGHFMHRCE